MKKVVLIAIMILLLLSLVGCGNTAATEAIEQGRLELVSKEYDKALSSFEKAINEGSEDEEIKELIKTIKSFNHGKKLIEEGNFDEAKEVLDSIDKDYVNYSIKDDINSLKEKIVTYEENDKFINNEIVSIDQLVSEGKYDDAKTKSEELLVSERIISEVQKQKVDEYVMKADEGIARIGIEAEKAQKEKLEKEKSEAAKVAKSEKIFCGGNHYVDKKDFIEREDRCKGCSIDRTLMSSSSYMDCPNCGAIGSVMRQDGICSDCNTKVIPAIVGLENDGTITYDDGTKGREDHNFFKSIETIK